MDKFLALSEEKQTSVIVAGFLCFGKMGYKKASASDIAASAGISKATLFHYFGSKKNFYVFLVNKAFDTMMSAFRDVYNPELTDIFDSLLNLTACKIATLKEYPNLLDFVMGLYSETDPEVRPEIDKMLSKGMNFRNEIVFTQTDTCKFKDSVDPSLVLKLLIRYSEGFANNASHLSGEDLEKLSDEFTQCILMLKNNFYKTEYL